MSLEPTLRELVFNAMDNACANGHGDFMRTGTLMRVCDDLLEFDADIERHCENMIFATDSIAPHVIAWRNQRNGK